ncbi:MAG TPA: ATP-binding cassette domain-containing protein, partial [Nitrospiria bacterium]|nr:ATP-binding cassette domain-containing protein [Nitrospiria bacterium]
MIDVRQLRRTFQTKKGPVTAVDEVSFSVDRGEIFGFLGPNGAGKTTTIGMLCTLLRPTSGTALLNGYDIVTQPHFVRKSIGLVFQDPSLDERLTARENLEFHARLYGVPRDLARQRIAQMLEMVELLTRQDDLVKNFSGGMKRRLEIARGLIHHPRILFLDEPTLGLDPQTRCLIWEYIRELQEKESITIFLTTHYMDEAENCGRIAIMDYGKLIALDTPSGLKKTAGGDRIGITTDQIDRAREFLYSRGLSPVTVRERELAFEVPNGEEFLPAFVRQAPFDVTRVSLTRPTLEDVFLRMT